MSKLQTGNSQKLELVGYFKPVSDNYDVRTFQLENSEHNIHGNWYTEDVDAESITNAPAANARDMVTFNNRENSNSREMVPLNLNGHSIPTVEYNGETWFKAKDTARALWYKDPRRAIYDICKEVMTAKEIGADKAGFHINTNFIPIREVHRLVIKSRAARSGGLMDKLISQVQNGMEILKALKDIITPDDMVEDYVYAIREVETGRFKFGFTNDPERRLQELQRCTSRKLELAGYFLTNNKVADERAIHQANSEHHIRGEWFDANATIEGSYYELN